MNYHRERVGGVLLPIVTACAALPAAAQTPTPPQPPGNFFFDYFLFDNLGQPAENYDGFFQWDVTGGTVDLVGGNVPGADDLPDGRYVDLGGASGDPGLFATRSAFPFAPGTTYELFFEYRSADGAPSSASATVAGQTFTVSTASTSFQRFSQTFTVGSLVTSPLTFQDLGADAAGVGIDAVLLNVVVPEPASAALLVAGGAALMTRRRRRIERNTPNEATR